MEWNKIVNYAKQICNTFLSTELVKDNQNKKIIFIKHKDIFNGKKIEKIYMRMEDEKDFFDVETYLENVLLDYLTAKIGKYKKYVNYKFALILYLTTKLEVDKNAYWYAFWFFYDKDKLFLVEISSEWKKDIFEINVDGELIVIYDIFFDVYSDGIWYFRAEVEKEGDVRRYVFKRVWIKNGNILKIDFMTEEDKK